MRLGSIAAVLALGWAHPALAGDGGAVPDGTRAAVPAGDGGAVPDGTGATSALAVDGGVPDAGLPRPEPDAGLPPPAPDPLPPGHEPRLSLSVDPADGLMTGDAFTFTVRAAVPEGDDVTVPSEQPFEPFDVLDKHARVEPPEQGRRTFVFELELLALEPGDHRVGPVRLRVVTSEGDVGEARTEPVPIQVGSLLANEPNAEPKPPTEPVRVMQDDYTLAWILGALGVILLTALATLLFARWWRRRPRPEAPLPPPRPAWQIALERLERLRRDQDTAVREGGIGEWVDGLSDALREYFGHRYGFDGLESTTDEVLARLRRVPLRGTSVPEVASVLGECDLVKFARASLSPERCTELLDEAFRVVRSTMGVHTPATDRTSPSAPTASDGPTGPDGPAGPATSEAAASEGHPDPLDPRPPASAPPPPDGAGP